MSEMQTIDEFVILSSVGPKLADCAIEALTPILTQFTTVERIEMLSKHCPIHPTLRNKVFKGLMSVLGDLQRKALIAHNAEIKARMPHVWCWVCKEYGRPEESDTAE